MSDEVGARLGAAERRLDEHEKRIAELETDMGEIRTYLGEVSTKDDIARLRTYIDGAINGILREALNAVPGWHSLVWGGIAAIAAIIAVAASLLH
ncbi:MAG: hypothetical protein ACREFZ_00900 [Acetobacteraceae bacterium]